MQKHMTKSWDSPHLTNLQEIWHLLFLRTLFLVQNQLESGKVHLSLKQGGIIQFLRSLVFSFESMAERNNISLNTSFPDEIDRAFYDKDKLEKILTNVLSNAFKYTPEGGQIDLIVEDDVQNIQISLSDSGRGIHQNDLPHIFDRFFQSNQENIPAEGGTGIGLALAKELITLMEGKIWAESEWGKGSIFYISFPKKERASQSVINLW